MKKLLAFQVFLLLVFLLFVQACVAQSNKRFTKAEADKWFSKRDWLKNVGSTKPAVEYDAFGRVLEGDMVNNHQIQMDLGKLSFDNSIDKVRFAESYLRRPERWKAAFSYLQQTNLFSLKAGKYPILGDTVFALVTDGPPKDASTAKWESHHRYIDVHYVISGKEKTALVPVSSAMVTVPYDSAKDIAFYTANGKFRVSDSTSLYIVFPPDAHCPAVAVPGYKNLKKIVLKVLE